MLGTVFALLAAAQYLGLLLLLITGLLRADTCTVTRVTDGDTVRAVCAGSALTLRLNAVDAPERSQPYGRESAKAVAELVLDRDVTVRAVDVDRYGRTVARITLADGRDLGRELVKAGLAWWYRKYAPDDW